MIVKSDEELEALKAASHAVAVTLRKMKEYAKIGMTTKELDEYGGELLLSFGAISAPIKDYQFPGHSCISLNNEACHGIPSTKVIKDGDLINIDVSAELNGFYGDNGCSFIMGEDKQNLQPLVSASNEILYEAIDKIKAGVRISDIGGLIEKAAKRRGFTVIKNICGHGIGRKLHESPSEIACWKDRSNRERFKRNSVIAVETFISTKARYVHEEKDGWTLSTKDGSFVTQHEHTMVVTNGYPLILTHENGIVDPSENITLPT